LGDGRITNEQIMANNDYHFITRWRIEGAITDVASVLKNAVDLPRWWPSVYLDVRELESGDQDGIGKVVSLHTRGWLPYTLSWQFRVTESRYPHGYTLEAWGDFNGRGIWTLEQEGEWVNVTYDWKIRADKPLLKAFSFLLKPVFSANHRWAMAKGQESLRAELGRLREQVERSGSVGGAQDHGMR
jgi:hypothetical protein